MKDGDVLQTAAVPVVGLAPVPHVASDRGVGELDNFQLLSDARAGVGEGAAGDAGPCGWRRIILYTDLIVLRSSARKPPITNTGIAKRVGFRFWGLCSSS